MIPKVVGSRIFFANRYRLPYSTKLYMHKRKYSSTFTFRSTMNYISKEKVIPATITASAIGYGAYQMYSSGGTVVAQDTPPEDDVKVEFKTAELNTMLQWSALLYSYTTVRDIVKKNSAVLNPGKEGTVTFKSPELVITSHIKEGDQYDGTHINKPITPTNILKFMRLNQKYLVGDEGGLAFNPEGDGNADYDGDGKTDLGIMKRLAQVDDEFDAEIVEFDDEFKSSGMSSELVFAIIINRTEKRVTIVFRGSVSAKDWVVDLSMSKVNPDMIKEFGGSGVFIHSGFADYLFGESNEEGKTKYDQIVHILNQIFAKEQYKDFNLYITGHSLGGGLTQLLAFTLAGSSSAKAIPKPINAISYASPRVGDKNFMLKYCELEKKGLVRHIRVSNEGDIICVSPQYGYHQAGLNLHVNEGAPIEEGYAKDRSFFSQVNMGALGKHNLKAYHKHLFTSDNAGNLGLSVEELYAKYSDVPTNVDKK